MIDSLSPSLLLLVLLSCLVPWGLAYPEGPPESACVDMQPGVTTGVVGLVGHLAEPQNVLPTFGNSKIPPYNIIIHKASNMYTPGEQIRVSIRANQTTGLVIFKGLLLQARRVICANDAGMTNETILVEDAPIGTFLSMSGSRLLKTMTCGNIQDSAVCHNSPQYKINETVTWVAPAVASGHVVFRATIVQEPYIYWMSVHSSILQDASLTEGPRTCGSGRPQLHGMLLIILALSLVFLQSSTEH